MKNFKISQELKEKIKNICSPSIKLPLKWVQTSLQCPEQYDVYCNGEIVAYVRERFKSLTVECPDCGGELIYEKHTSITDIEKEIISEKISEWVLKNSVSGNSDVHDSPITVAELAVKLNQLVEQGCGDCLVYLQTEKVEEAVKSLELVADGGDGTCLLRGCSC